MFGGISCEHEISILTALQLIKNISKEKYRIYPIFIDKNGTMLYNKNFVDLQSFKQKHIKGTQILIKNGNIYKITGNFTKKLTNNVYCAILCFHGRNGEDAH